MAAKGSGLIARHLAIGDAALLPIGSPLPTSCAAISQPRIACSCEIVAPVPDLSVVKRRSATFGRSSNDRGYSGQVCDRALPICPRSQSRIRRIVPGRLQQTLIRYL